MLEAYELARRKAGAEEAADAVRAVRDRFGDIPRLTQEEIEIITTHEKTEKKRLEKELEKTQRQERIRQRALRREERERRFEENQERIFRERLTAPRVEIGKFDQGTEENLKGEGYLIHTLNGVNRNVFRGRVRGFPYYDFDNRDFKSSRSQVAIRPGDLVPDDFTATDWETWGKLYRQIPERLKSVMALERVSGVTVTRGTEMDYMQLVFLHLLETGEHLFGEGVYVRGTEGFIIGNQKGGSIEVLEYDPLSERSKSGLDPSKVFLAPIVFPNPVQGTAYSRDLIKLRF